MKKGRSSLNLDLDLSLLRSLRPCWAAFLSILLNQVRFRNNTDRGGSVTASEWGIPWEGMALV